MAKTTIINVEIREELNTAYVTYSTGTEKLYPANKLPKTVQAWLDAKAEEEKREEFLSKREAANLKRDSGLDVIEYSEWNGKEVALTEEELVWFHSVADKCKAATGCTIPITAFNNELCFDRDGKEALGTCWTDNPDNPLDGETTITVDTWFIHEKYRNKIGELPMLTDATLESVICHEIAHLYVWEHGEDHDRKTQELLEMVEAYGHPIEETVEAVEEEPEAVEEAVEAVVKQVSTQASEHVNTQVRKLPATTQKPELTVPVEAEIVKDNSMGAAEAVAFGTCIAMAVAFWGIVGLIQVLAAGIETLACWAWNHREQAAAGCRTAVRWIGSKAKAMAACLPTVTTRRSLLVAVRVLPILIGMMALI